MTMLQLFAGKCQNEIRLDMCGVDSVPLRCPSMDNVDCASVSSRGIVNSVCSCQSPLSPQSDLDTCLGML